LFIFPKTEILKKDKVDTKCNSSISCPGLH